MLLGALRSTEHSTRSTVHGTRSTVHGTRYTVHGTRSTEHGTLKTVYSVKCRTSNFNTLDKGSDKHTSSGNEFVVLAVFNKSLNNVELKVDLLDCLNNSFASDHQSGLDKYKN